MNRFRYLPQSLQTMVVVLAVCPFLVVVLATDAVNALETMPVWYQTLLIASYVIMPWVLAWLMVQRHEKFLHALIGECAVLLAIACIPDPALPSGLNFLHYAFVMTMVALALMMINKDLLFPFVFAGYRGFRRAPRIAVNQRVRLTGPTLPAGFDLMIEDCSTTGLALYGSELQLDDLVMQLRRGEAVMVSCRVGKTTHEVTATYLWQSHLSEVIKIGLRARDTDAMAKLFEVLAPRQVGGVPAKFQAMMAKPAVRRACSYALAAALLALMLLPPLLTRNVQSPVPSGGVAARPDEPAEKPAH